MTDSTRAGDQAVMERWRLGMCMVVLVAGCVGGSKEIGATVADTAGESTEGQTEGQTEGGTSSSSGDSDPTSVGTMSASSTTADTDVGETTTAPQTGSETTGGLSACEEATTQAQCDAFPSFEEGAAFECGWVPTIVYAGGCNVVETGFEGQCAQVAQDDSCGTIETATCPDDTTVVYFSPLGLEIGAIEVLVLQIGVCSEVTAGFEPCVVIDDGETITYEPPECGCACPA